MPGGERPECLMGSEPHRARLRQPNRFVHKLFSSAQALGKIPDTVGNGGGDPGSLFIAGFNRKHSTQGHAPQRAIAQDELVPDGHQGVQSGEDEDDGSGILMQFGDQAGSPLNGLGERRKLQAEERY